MGKGRLGWGGLTADSTWRAWRPLRRAQGLELVETAWRENNSTGAMQANDGRVAETNCSRQGRRFDALRLL